MPILSRTLLGQIVRRVYFLEIEKPRPVNQMNSDGEKSSDVEFFAATLLGGALEH
jgi:hypothetical protein